MYQITVKKSQEINGEIWQTIPTKVEIQGTVREDAQTGQAYHKIKIFIDDKKVFEDTMEWGGTREVAQQRAKKWLTENTNYHFLQHNSEIKKDINFDGYIKEVSRKKDMI